MNRLSTSYFRRLIESLFRGLSASFFRLVGDVPRIPEHPLVDLAIGAALALIVLIISPGVAVSAMIALVVLVIIALTGVRAARRRRRRPPRRQVHLDSLQRSRRL